MSMREPAFQTLDRPRPVSLAGLCVLVLGLGDSGLSAARWVTREGARVRVADTRAQPPGRAVLERDLPHAQMRLGAFDEGLLDGVDLVCISPGLSLEDPLVRAAVARAVPVLGDVELFSWALAAQVPAAPVIAVTGTNGKTTVTALVGHILRTAGLDAEVAGNISPPVLGALMSRLEAGRLPQAWVLELSSYQLETTWSLSPAASAVLNLSEDHLDRYPGLDAYGAAKARVFAGAGLQVVNRDDPRTMAMAQPDSAIVRFGVNAPELPSDFGLIEHQGEDWISQGATPLIALRALQIPGRHNAANAMAALALVSTLGAPMPALLEGLCSFRGLPHRVERVSGFGGVDWYDDSKGTNVGATLAALEGLARRTVLIAGGVGKGQDFSPLASAVKAWGRTVILIGEDAPAIGRALAMTGVPLERCATLEEAVTKARLAAQPGDAVLLSPACASFDMFRDYRHRGEAFAAAVRALEQAHG